MLREFLDDSFVKKAILTFCILITIMLIAINIPVAIKFFMVGKIFAMSCRILSCLTWLFLGGCAAYVIYRDFIRKKKNVRSNNN